MEHEAREELLIGTVREGVLVRIGATAQVVCRAVAREMAGLIRQGGHASVSIPVQTAVLGLATGKTPLGVYVELAQLRRARGLDCEQVTTFNLDEYLGLPPDHPASFRAYVQRHVQAPLGLDPTRVHVPDGSVERVHAAQVAADYERSIDAAGGIDLQLLGIGVNGHLAFNEPGSPRSSRTRVVELAAATRAANQSDFPVGEQVPTHAITMGIATILGARRLRVLAFGAHKAAVVRRALEEPVGPGFPATFLREHGDVELLLDRAAAAELRA